MSDLRTFTDGDGDQWFEVEPGVVRLAGVLQNRADVELDHAMNRGRARPLSSLEGMYGPIVQEVSDVR